MLTMRDKVVVLARARAEQDELSSAIVEVGVAIAASPLGQKRAQLVVSLANMKELVLDLDQTLREDAIAQYNKTGEKSPHPAVIVKVYKTLNYDAEEAKNYAMLHLPRALKLDRRMFEKAARAIEPAFVMFGEQLRTTISKDLSKYLGPPNDPG